MRKGRKVLTHEDGGEKPELPAEEDALEDGKIPGMVPAEAQSRCRLLFLFLGEKPCASMGW